VRLIFSSHPGGRPAVILRRSPRAWVSIARLASRGECQGQGSTGSVPRAALLYGAVRSRCSAACPCSEPLEEAQNNTTGTYYTYPERYHKPVLLSKRWK